jgi:hypothetical protein
MVKRWLLLAAALAMLLAGCGSGASAEGIASLEDQAAADESSTTAAAAATDPEQAMLDYAQCMRDQGIDMPDPQMGPGGGAFGFTIQGEPGDGPEDGEIQRMTEADEACRHLLEGIVQEFEMPDMSEMQDQMLAFSQCMRDHGVDMPDPEFSEDGSVTMFGGPGDPGMDPSDPTFQQAQEACQEIFGGGPGGMVITGTVGPGPGGEGAEGGMVIIGGDGAVPAPGGDD